MRYLKQNTDSYVTVGPFIDVTDGKTLENSFTVTNITGVITKETHASSATHQDFTCDATASNDWGMEAVGHGGLYILKIPDAHINFVGSAKLVLLDADECLPVWEEFMVVPANVWDSLMGTAYLKVDIETIKTATVAATSTVTFKNGTIPITTDVPTTAAIATGVWQDATAGDFTTASSIGKALYINNVAPGGSGGHMISGTNAGTTVLGALTVTGATTLTGQVTGTNASNDLRGISVNMIKDQSVTCTTGVTFNANVGTTQPINFTGTSSSALVKSDMVDIAGAAVNAASAQVGVNVVNFGGAAGTFASGIPAVNATQVEGADATDTIQASCDAALVANHLDHIFKTAYDPASKPGDAEGLLNELVESDSGVSRFTVNALENAPSGTGASAETIADAVWDEAINSGHSVANSAGKILYDNLNAPLNTIDDNVDAILADTGTDGVVIAAAGADTILDEAVEGSYTLRQMIRMMGSVLLGKSSGGGTATLVFKNAGGTTTRVTATVDADGNRTDITLDATS